MLPHRDSSSIFPRSSVCCPAFALGLCGFATAKRTLVAALLLFGFGNNGRDLQPPSVPVHGDEGKISGCNFLARRGDVVLHQDLHTHFHGSAEDAVHRGLQDHHVADVHGHEEVDVVHRGGHRVGVRVSMRSQCISRPPNSAPSGLVSFGRTSSIISDFDSLTGLGRKLPSFVFMSSLSVAVNCQSRASGPGLGRESRDLLFLTTCNLRAALFAPAGNTRPSAARADRHAPGATIYSLRHTEGRHDLPANTRARKQKARAGLRPVPHPARSAPRRRGARLATGYTSWRSPDCSPTSAHLR